MPSVTGVELLSKVRVRHPHAVRMLFTGYTEVESIIAAINQGHIFQFLKKPWQPEELENAVREAAAEYDRLVGPELAEGKVAALRRTAETASEAQLDLATAETWLRALNDLRLVLGTRLGVTEDTFAGGLLAQLRPPLAIYGWLTWLEGELIEALASA
jgi:response regulator RpfG family c-di-GMP phosphodiesterase